MKLLLWMSLIFLVPTAKAASFTGASEVFREEHIQVQLLSSERHLQPGTTATFALRLLPDQHWHVYWKNPGDSGNPPEVRWAKPSGWVTHPFIWPTPERILVDPFYSFGYQGEVILPFTVAIPETLNGPAQDLEVLVKWLVCEETCIPGKRTFSFTMPVTTSAESEPGTWKTVIEQAQKQGPQGPLSATMKTAQDAVTLTLAAEDLPQGTRIVEFFPHESTGVKYSPPQIKDRTIVLEKNSEVAVYPLSGLLVLEKPDGQRLSYDLQLASEAAPNWLSLLLLAFLGGLILNAMPCVLPVLAIKVLSLVRESGSDVKKIRAGSLSYGAGVVISFLGLAGLLLLVKAGGQAVGWGFQLQSPAFIAALALLFFLLALNFLDLIQPWNALTRVGGQGQGQFLSGVLAVAVASPCTGPFMGVAVGSALTRSPLEALLIFLFIALGFLSPFLALAWIPGSRRLLPKPGMWMETFRQAMAFPLLITILWLLWVLEKQTGMNGVLWILSGFVGLGFAAWLWAQMKHKERSWIAITLLILIVCVVAIRQQKPVASASNGPAAGSSQLWKPFTAAGLQEARRKGPVFVDFTAAWCVTCQVNKTLVLNRAEIEKAFTDRGIQLMRADWTDYNPEITQTLAGMGRQGVPVYAFYFDESSAPQLLPEVLTTDLVLKEIGKISRSER